ncbi:MAG TPA: prepilin-type N-terminal cleavage/methylation domain-containing protein [Solirubrobacteraceae bacterium]|jgi:type IV pilus assembly protein PilA|nr:prepilin-type N-terminal cleavage/methylation domain-containing protein [Solirubrobacteraceae bacterium]
MACGDDERDMHLPKTASDDQGFTLIELLVVILIIGILAAIAIPAFLSQTGKANDSAAKTQVGTLQTTIQAYAAEHNGSYEGGSLTELQKIEPTLKDTTTATAAVLKVEPEVFEVASTAKGTGSVYKLKNEKGTITRTCTAGASKGACPAAGTW